MRGDDAEEGQATALKETQEEARSEEIAVALTRRHGSLSDAPSEAQGGHEDAVRYPHDEVRREGLHHQLPDGRDRAHERILVPRQMRRLLKTERGAVAQNRLVEDLEEVDPDEDCQDDLVCLPSDTSVLRISSAYS